MNYRSKEDMQELSNKLLRAKVTPELCAGIVDNNIMIIRQLWVRIPLKLIKFTKGTTESFWTRAELKGYGDMMTDLVNNTAKWIVDGKDATTTDAAGGLNQKEVDTMNILLWNVP